MWTNGTEFYVGDCRPGDRAATSEEVTAYNLKQATEAKKTEILAELNLIDKKTIRPMSEGETERITELRVQAAKLRDELKTL